MSWIKDSGWLGWVAFIALYTFTCIFFLPGSFLTLGAGAVYGFWGGTLLVTASSTVGAAANFLLTRTIARRLTQRLIERNARFRAFDEAIGREGWKIVFMSRLSPIVPHSVVSYVAGLTQMSFTKYTVISWLGFIPISAAYAYVGTMAGSITRDAAGVHKPPSWLLYGVGLAITAVVAYFSTVISAKAMREALEKPKGKNGA